jgi:hypothetical protein
MFQFTTISCFFTLPCEQLFCFFYLGIVWYMYFCAYYVVVYYITTYWEFTPLVHYRSSTYTKYYTVSTCSILHNLTFYQRRRRTRHQLLLLTMDMHVHNMPWKSTSMSTPKSAENMVAVYSCSTCLLQIKDVHKRHSVWFQHLNSRTFSSLHAYEKYKCMAFRKIRKRHKEAISNVIFYKVCK